MNCRSLYLGIIGPVCYLAAVIIGGAMTPGYSHYYNSVSELTVAGQKLIPGVVILFVIYNVALILIGIQPAKVVNSILPKTALRLIGMIGLLGILTLIFRQDPRGSAATLAGTLHIIMAGLLSLATIAAAVLGGFVFRQVKKPNLATASWIFTGIIFVTGIITAVSLGGRWASLGLWERLTIGSFLAWLPWFALSLKGIIKKDYI